MLNNLPESGPDALVYDGSITEHAPRKKFVSRDLKLKGNLTVILFSFSVVLRSYFATIALFLHLL